MHMSVIVPMCGRDGTGLGEKVNSVYPWSTSPVSPIDKERTDAARRTTDDKEGREGKAANEFRVNGLAISLIQSGMSMSATSTMRVKEQGEGGLCDVMACSAR